ncbi:D-glycero-beta-D-manno-heptose 1,7-bisphosphate 7-phosphatase [Chloroflexota bacterium]
MHPAVFLDRDGVINENRGDYVRCWDEVRFLPGVFGALARLARAPFRIVLVTNQSPIGRGILTEQQVKGINRRLVAEIEAHGGRVDGVYYCPHDPDDGCECRKPNPGLLLQAARELRLDLTRSYLIGDAASDVEAALAAGCSPIFVLTGRGRGQRSLLQRQGTQHVPVAQDLIAAVRLILDDEWKAPRNRAARVGTESELASSEEP